LRANATLLWSRYAGAFTGEEWKPRAVEIVWRGLEEAGEEGASFETGALRAGRAGFRFWKMAPHSKEDARRDAERAVTIAEAIDSPTLLSYGLDALVAEVTQDGFCESAELARRALAVARSIEDRGEAHELLVTAALTFADAGRFDEAAVAGAEATMLASQLGPHRSLHAGSAQTRALLPPGRLGELLEATAKAPDLVVEEGMHTCFHGVAALAGQAIAAFEAGDGDAAKRALEVYDTTAVSGVGIYASRGPEILRPLIGAEGARRRLDTVEEAERTDSEVYRLRVELQLTALERDRKRFGIFAGNARSLARSACAPYLDWIADWGESIELAESGRTSEATAKARAAASALEAYGERYLAARLLADLLPFLDAGAADELAEEAVRRLEAMGARGSAEEAKRWASRS
jgi:hypothetical protein